MARMLNLSTQMLCPHGGQVQVVSSNTRVKGGGAYLLRASDTFTIVGCPLTLGIVYHPCVQVRWVQPAAQSKGVGDFTLNDACVGLCVAADQAVQGTVQVSFTQSRVSGR
jgi:hypothetical protein